MDLDSSDVRTLVDIGFMALTHGLNDHATAIFDGVRAVRPAEEAAPIGLAMVKMAEGDHAGAVGLLKALPPSDAALTFLGLAHARMGAVAEARDALDYVIRTAPESPHADIARATLAELG